MYYNQHHNATLYPLTSHMNQPQFIPQRPYQSYNQLFHDYITFEKNTNIYYERQNLEIGYQYMCNQMPMPLEPWLIDFPSIPPVLNDLFEASNFLVKNTGLKSLGVMVALLAIINSGTCGRIFVDCDPDSGWKESSVIQSLYISASGTGKSHVWDKIIEPVYVFLAKEYEGHAVEFGHAEKRISDAIQKKQIDKILASINLDDPETIAKAKEAGKMIDSTSKSNQSSTIPKIVLSSFTPYALAKTLAENGGSALLHTPEGEGLVETLKKLNFDLLLHSYSQEAYSYVSGRKEIFLPSPAVYAAVAMQESSALKMYAGKKAREFHERGLTSRWLPYVNFCAKAPGGINLFADSSPCYQRSEGKQWDSRVMGVYKVFHTTNNRSEKYLIPVTSEGRQHLVDFRTWLDFQCADADSNMRPWMSKLHGQAARLALGIHLWHYGAGAINHQISVEEIDAGIFIASQLIPHAMYLFSPYGMSARNTAHRIAAHLQRIVDPAQRRFIQANGLTTTQLQQKTGLQRELINNALYALARSCWAVIWDNGSGNLTVRFHPQIYAML